MAQPTALEASLAAIIGTFHKYAGDETAECNLNKKELVKLLNEELPHLADVDKMDEMLQMLDQDGDGMMNFSEYITLIGTLAFMCNQFVAGKM